jgi:hypothetical protein
MGRPTDYTEEVLEKAKDYLTNFNTEHSHTIPSVVGLAKVLGKHKDTLYEWAKDPNKEEFSDTLRQINNDQEFELVEGGLTNKFNSSITKLALGNHGYSDKQESDITSGGKPIQNEWHIHPVTTNKNGED